MNLKEHSSDRRSFLGSVATGALAVGVTTLATPLQTMANHVMKKESDDPDDIFKQLKGKHRMIFDATGPHEIFPFAWPRVFLMTNEIKGASETNASAVVVLRHNAIPYAMNDELWAKYKFGEFFKINDAATKTSSVRNAFWKPKATDFVVPGLGNAYIGINELQESGVIFVVCNVALTVYSNVLSEPAGMKPEDVKKEFMNGLLPGVHVVPSGVWAVGRAQEHGCAYCFVG